MVRICKLCKLTVLRESQKSDICSPCQEKIGEKYQESEWHGPKNSSTDLTNGNHKGEELTVRQIAERIHYSERTIRNWIHEGIIRANRLPGTRKYFISWEEIHRASELRPEHERRLDAEPPEETLGYYYTRLSTAMEMLKPANKSIQNVTKASAILEEIPFREDTARLYADFLDPTAHFLKAEEKTEVLEGFRIIYGLNRSRADPAGVNLRQRCAHWMARSGEEDFTTMIRRLYRKTDMPPIKRGMMVGLIFAELMEPEEFLNTFLNTEANRKLDMLICQLRSKDVPYDLKMLLDKEIKIGPSFNNSLQTLLDEQREYRCKPYSVLSLRTLNNMLAYGKENVLRDLNSVLSLPTYRADFNKILQQDGVSVSFKAEVEKIKKFVRGHSAEIKSLQTRPGDLIRV